MILSHWMVFFLGIGTGMGVISLGLRRKQRAIEAPGPAPANEYSQLQALQAMNLQLLRLAQFKAGFLARTTHELRSPLSTVMSLHQLILNNLCDSPEEERQCLKDAYNASQQLLDMLELVTQVSKSELGSRPLQIQAVSLHHLLEDFYIFSRLQTANRSLRLQIDFPDPNIQIQADPNCLRQALLCLLEPILSDRSATQVRLFPVVDVKSGLVQLRFVDDRPPEAFQETVDLFKADPPTSTALSQELLPDPAHPTFYHFSSNMMLLMAQTFLELMKGHLELVEVEQDFKAGEQQPSQKFCFQCSLPLVQ
jgi:hypothetical protein